MVIVNGDWWSPNCGWNYELDYGRRCDLTSYVVVMVSPNHQPLAGFIDMIKDKDHQTADVIDLKDVYQIKITWKGEINWKYADSVPCSHLDMMTASIALKIAMANGT